MHSNTEFEKNRDHHIVHPWSTGQQHWHVGMVSYPGHTIPEQPSQAIST